MRFFLKILSLLGLIVISRLEKQTAVHAIAQKARVQLSVPAYQADRARARTLSSRQDLERVLYTFSFRTGL